jgi:hypothetical protein
MKQKNFFEFNIQSLKHFLVKDLQIEEKKVSMRSKQIWQSVYKKGSFEINNLTTFPLELRDKLNNLISLQRPEIIKTEISNDGTMKWLIKLFSDVYMCYKLILLCGFLCMCDFFSFQNASAKPSRLNSAFNSIYFFVIVLFHLFFCALFCDVNMGKAVTVIF